MAELGSTLVVGLLLLGFLLFGVEFGDAAVGLCILFVDFHSFLVVADGFAVVVLLGVGAADEAVGFALFGGSSSSRRSYEFEQQFCGIFVE